MEEKGECRLEGRGCSDGERVTGKGGRGLEWREFGEGLEASSPGRGCSNGRTGFLCQIPGEGGSLGPSGKGMPYSRIRVWGLIGRGEADHEGPSKAVTKNLANSTV